MSGIPNSSTKQSEQVADDSFRVSIYGIDLDVRGPASSYFASELADIPNSIQSKREATVSVHPTEEGDLPTKPAGSRFGIRLPFGGPNRTILYDPRTDPYVLFSYAEASLMWANLSFLHAGAVSDDRGAYLFTGSGGIGKTSTTLAMIRHGYEYLADDWLIVGGGSAFPYPKRVHIFDYNISDKEFAKRLLGIRRLGYRFVYRLLNVGMAIAPHRLIVYGLEQAKPRIQSPISEVIPGSRVGGPSRIRKVFYLVKAKTPKWESFSIPPEELGRRLASVNRYERDYFYREYFKYVEAFGSRDSAVEARLNEEVRILSDTFRGAEIIGLRGPQGDPSLPRKVLQNL